MNNLIKRRIDDIINWMQEYKDRTNCKGVVLGLSGGKDSTVVAMLSKLVFGDEVLAIIMPNGVQKDIRDAINVAETLGIKYKIVNIETTFNNLVLNIESKVENGDWVENCCKISEKALTNIAPRLRMTTLYAVAQTLGYRVIGTGNASERAIGWFTKYGDGGCDFNPIGERVCSEVVEMGIELCKQFGLDTALITKTPADGLTGKSDEDNFGFTYKQLDNYLLDGTSGNVDIDMKISKLRKLSRHKLRTPYVPMEVDF